MKKAGLLESPRRNYFKITDRGIQALKTDPEVINYKFLEQYPEFREFKAKSNTKIATAELEDGTRADAPRSDGGPAALLPSNDAAGESLPD
jgi:restriction system protein